MPVHVSRRAALGVGGLALASPFIAACTGNDDPSSNGDDPSNPNGQIDQVNYLTGFGQSAREVFALVAQTTGIAAEHGISFSIEAGRGGDYNHQQLAGGSVDIMAADSSGAFARYVDGVDDTFQVLAAVHNRWPMALLGYADRGVNSPRDLNGKTIGLAEGTIAQRMWPTYAELTTGIDPDSVEVIATDASAQVGQLIAGELDAIALFGVSAPGLSAARQGAEVTVLPWADAFPDMHGNCIIASKALIAENPDLVRRCVAALLDGLAYTLENPQEAGQIWADEFQEGTAEVGAREIELMRDFCFGSLQPGQPLGYFDEVRVADQLALLSALGEISEDPSRFLPASNGARDEGVVNFELMPQEDSSDG